MILLVDVDGTISDHSHRVHHVMTEGKKNWAAYYGGIHLDPPIEAAQAALKKFSERPDVATIYLLTGRPEEYRQTTEMWLDKYFPFLFSRPLMRPTGDRTRSKVFKAQFIDAFFKHGQQIIFIDDDLRNEEIYVRRGIFLKAPECWEVFR